MTADPVTREYVERDLGSHSREGIKAGDFRVIRLAGRLRLVSSDSIQLPAPGSP